MEYRGIESGPASICGLHGRITGSNSRLHMKITIERLNDDFHFRATNDTGNTVDMDNTGEGDDPPKGVGPMQMLAMALGGCSGIDVVSILKKSRQPIVSFDMEIEGERETGVVPSLYKTLHVHYILTGELDEEKVRRAVQLSMEKYCSVAKTLEHTATITYSFSVNGRRFDA